MSSTFETATAEHVQELIAGPPGLRVSLFLPVPADPGFDEVREFPLRYRAAVKEAAERMASLKVAARKADEIERRLADQAVELSALHPSTRGIALLHGPDGLRRLAMARPVEASLHVGRTFHVRPLLASAHQDPAFRVGTLRPDEVGLFEGDAWGLVPIAGDRVPPVPGREPGSAPARGRADRNGGAQDARELDRDRVHRALASALKGVWNGRSDPIVLVADRAHDGRFRSVADMPALLAEGVVGNPAGWSDEELHRRAFDVVRAWLERSDRRHLERAQAAVVRGRATDELATAAELAAAGGVSTVFVAPEVRIAMHLDAATGVLLDALGDEDALDELCAMVIAHGGSAAVIDAVQGGASPLVAELRG